MGPVWWGRGSGHVSIIKRVPDGDLGEARVDSDSSASIGGALLRKRTGVKLRTDELVPDAVLHESLDWLPGL